MASDYGPSPSDWFYECCGELNCKCTDQNIDECIAKLEGQILGLESQIVYKQNLLKEYRELRSLRESK